MRILSNLVWHYGFVMDEELEGRGRLRLWLISTHSPIICQEYGGSP